MKNGDFSRGCSTRGRRSSSGTERRLIEQCVDHYNTVRLDCPIAFLTPIEMLAGREIEIHDARDHKRAEARLRRQLCPATR